MFYAQINKDNICFCVSNLSGKLEDKQLIEIPEYDTSIIGKKYEDGKWVEVDNNLKQEQPKVPTLEEQILSIQEAIATIYEDRLTNNLKIDETLATIYETIIEKEATV